MTIASAADMSAEAKAELERFIKEWPLYVVFKFHTGARTSVQAYPTQHGRTIDGNWLECRYFDNNQRSCLMSVHEGELKTFAAHIARR